MSDEEEVKLDPSDEVLAVRLFKKDPFCLEYAFLVEGKDGQDDPKHLEQLNVVLTLLQKYIEQAEKAVIHNTLLSSRRLRRAQAEQLSNLETKGEAS